MDRWIAYFNERFSLGFDLIAVLGLALSGLYVNYGFFQLYPMVFSCIGIILLFASWRMMEELRSFDKDKIANPGGPLPRGLLYKDEFESAVSYLQAGLFLYSLLLWVLFSTTPAICYLLIAVYMWHMDREFFIGKWLTKKPILHEICHQIVILLLGIFVVAIGRPAEATSFGTLSFAFLLFGAFFTYEIARKLDPQLHPILVTTVQYHGFRKTYYVAAAALLISAFSAHALREGTILWPVQFAVFVSFSWLFLDSTRFYLTERVAGISLMIHLWAGYIQYWE